MKSTHSLTNQPDVVLVARRKQHMHNVRFVVLVLITAFPVVLLYSVVRGEVTRIQSKKAERAGLIQGLNAIAELNQNRGRAEEALLALERASPSVVDVPSKIFPQLVTTARAHGLSATFQVTGNSDSAPPGVTFEGVVGGAIQDLVNYFIDVESSPAIVKITTLEFQPEGKGYRALVSGTVFTRVE